MVPPPSDSHLPSVARAGQLLVSTRAAALCLSLLVAAAVCSRLVGAEQPWAAALKVVLPTLAIAVVPGALATMLWRPRPELTLLEVIGYGAAFTFGLVHLLTIAAIAAHLSTSSVLLLLAVGSVLAAVRIVRRSSGAVVVSVDELIVLVLLVALGTVLYFHGSPFDTFEDQVHVAIVRRLSQLQSPTLDNFYFAPGIVYTYPFPGTHYVMALVARLGDIDALFLYHKLRFVWGPAALVMLYLAASSVFGSRAVACAVTIAAVALVGTGIFAMVPGLSWSQLVPYSHTSDVAMTVLLPAALVAAFGFLRAETRREKTYFFTTAALLVVMLTFVHIRETVQLAVYLGCFLAASVVVRDLRPYARRAFPLLAFTLAVAAIYTLWQARTATLTGDIVGGQRARLLAAVTASPLSDVVFGPVSSVLAGFVPYFDQLWSGLTPFFLFAGPAVVLLFRLQPFVWLISASMLFYLAVMTVPLLAVPYIYLTYFEILYTPVRNIIFFVYLFAGAFLYAAAVALTRVDRIGLLSLVAGAVTGVVALMATLSLDRSSEGFLLPLLAAYALTLVLASGRLTATASRRVVGVAIVALLALVALWPDRQPVPRTEFVNVRWTAGLSEERRVALEQRFRLSDGEPTSDHSDDVNVWVYRLHDLSTDNVRALVTEADVVDTHQIDRSTFTVPPQPPRAEHPFLGVERVTWLQYPGAVLTMGTVLFVWILGLLLPAALVSAGGVRLQTSLAAAFRAPFYRHAVPFALCLVPFSLWSARPTLSPLQPAMQAATPEAMLAAMPCVTTPQLPAPFSEDILPGELLLLPEQMGCPPPYAVVEWVTRHVPVEGIFAINRWNPHLPTVFIPQQVVVFPRVERTFIDEYELFRGYYRFYEERLRAHRVQPFFNAIESEAERAAFVRALGVTHVLVDPAYSDELRPVLDALPDQYVLLFSHEKWAVYEVAGHRATGREDPR
jgi:hypothetical protein